MELKREREEVKLIEIVVSEGMGKGGEREV